MESAESLTFFFFFIKSTLIQRVKDGGSCGDSALRLGTNIRTTQLQTAALESARVLALLGQLDPQGGQEGALERCGIVAIVCDLL